MSEAIRLADRGVIEITGEDAAKFLHGLATNDILSLASGEARFAALLTPQGKVLFDFLVFAVAPQLFLLDCPLALADDLAKSLSLYKLRTKAVIANRSNEMEALAFLDEPSHGAQTIALAPDPRNARLGWRALATKGAVLARDDITPYEARRISVGVPLGGVDFDYGGAFPHEANMDLLNGVDFKKGCYVGQEVVSRMKHRGLVRRRVRHYRTHGGAPPPGVAIRVGEMEIGATGSRLGQEGLAMIRLDRLADAQARGEHPVAAGVTLIFTME